MTRIYDTSVNTSAATQLPICATNGRCIEANDHGGYKNFFVSLTSTSEISYSYGDTNSWTTNTITGSGSATGYDLADITEVVIGIDHNNDHAHIAFISDNKVYHMQLEDIDDPTTAGDWRTYGAVKYERVDNTSYAKSHVAITVCSNNGNGGNRPHIVWDENNTVSSKYEVHWNYGAGANEAFTAANEKTLLSDDYRYPTITSIADVGRQLYMACMKTGGYVLNVLRCKDADDPMTVSNWKGPQSGTTTPDMMFGLKIDEGYASPPSITWWYDANEVVMVTGTYFGSTSSTVYTRTYLDASSSWNPPHEATNYSSGTYGIAIESIVCQLKTSDFRLVIRTAAHKILHCRCEPDGVDDYTFDSDWYLSISESMKPGRHVCIEEKGREHDDSAVEYKRCHGLDINGTDDLLFYQFRENSSPHNTQVTPVDGATLAQSAGHDITLDWGYSDDESDTQEAYWVQVDDDQYFGSPTIDGPSSSWQTTATSSHTITGGTLSGQKMYYWRLKTRDNETGTYERDPYSTETYPDDLRWFNTTPQLQIWIEGYDVQSDKDVYISLRFVCGIDSAPDRPNADLDDGSTVYAQYNTGSGWTTMTVISGECSSSPSGPITTSKYPGTYYKLAWNADADVGGTYEGTVQIRVRGRYDGDSEGMGFTDYTAAYDVELDFAGPTVTLGWPNGEDVVDRTPTLNAAIADPSGFESRFMCDAHAADLDLGDTPTYDSGWVDSAMTYTIPSSLTPGAWYFGCHARDKTPSQNTTSVTTGAFTILEGGYYANILDDGTNTVTLHIISTMDYKLENLVIEYDGIMNDFANSGMNQNVIEYRGHKPLEISFDVFIYGPNKTDDMARLHKWMIDNTKLTFVDATAKAITFGTTIGEYCPDNWRIIRLSESNRAGEPNTYYYTISLREVTPS